MKFLRIRKLFGDAPDDGLNSPAARVMMDIRAPRGIGDPALGG